VVAHARVAVEEAVLLAGIDVVAGDACGERRLVVVERAGALGIGRVDQAVPIVVDAVAALRAADGDLAAPGPPRARARGAVERVERHHGLAAAGRGEQQNREKARQVPGEGEYTHIWLDPSGLSRGSHLH